jgi:hypothetical protein
MCQAAISLTSKALYDVADAEVLLKIKGFISLFTQTMEVKRTVALNEMLDLTNIILARDGATLLRSWIASYSRSSTNMLNSLSAGSAMTSKRLVEIPF